MAGGRSLGTFNHPARRARAWHWLAATMALDGANKARDLDRPDNPLNKGLVPKPRFDQIRQDGYDPDRVTAFGTTSLLDHVASKRHFKETRRLYQHIFWKHLEEWAPVWPRRGNWLTEQLRKHSIQRFATVDEANGVELGLLSELSPWQPAKPSAFLSDPARFVTLDGLLLLLVLFREARDAAHFGRANRLQWLLCQAAAMFADQFQYAGEVLDTWGHLIDSRMIAWRPHVEPSAEALARAESQLREEDGCPPDHVPPRSKPQTRSERRWRRRVWVRACCLYDDRGRGDHGFDYCDANPLVESLIHDREAILQHRDRATRLLVLGEDLARANDLPPMVMPKSVYAMRRRPTMSEDERRLFGDTSVYDVIPVEES